MSKQKTPVEPNRFDGRPFGLWHGGDAGDLLPLLYLAKKARDGDADARALLTAFGVVIHDGNGGRYWPPVEGDPTLRSEQTQQTQTQTKRGPRASV